MLCGLFGELYRSGKWIIGMLSLARLSYREWTCGLERLHTSELTVPIKTLIMIFWSHPNASCLGLLKLYFCLLTLEL
jgi:hypothetical protein